MNLTQLVEIAEKNGKEYLKKRKTKTIQLNKLETLSQKIADYCTEQDLPNWYTVDELLELDQVINHHITLTYNQKEQLYRFKEQLEKL